MEGRTRRRKVRLFQFMRKAWRGGAADTARVSSLPRPPKRLASVGRWEDGRAIEARTNSWKERTLPTPARPVSVAAFGQAHVLSATRYSSGPGRTVLRLPPPRNNDDRLSPIRRACRPVGRPQDRGTASTVGGHRRPPRHPVHDPGSRESDGQDYAGDGNGVDRSSRLFFRIERNQRVDGEGSPRARRLRQQRCGISATS